MNILLLTCANKKEAVKIARALLKGKLVVCTKATDVSSQYLWKGSLDKGEESLLIMESHESKFQEIEKRVRELHSYEQFVLIGFSVTQMASGVEEWMKEEMDLK